MTTFSEGIIGKIKGDHIAPVPRWHFLFRNCAFWAFFVVSVVLGSLSFGVIEHIVSGGDFSVLDHLKGSLFTSTFMLLPAFWVLFLFLFAIVAYYNWKHTKIGYRFKRRWIFLGSLVLSFLFGSIFYAMGFGQKIDLLMVKALPFYNKSKHDGRIELWQQPEEGLLIGKIVDTSADQSSFVVEDGTGMQWNIGAQVKNKTKTEIQNIEKKGEIVKIVGVKSDKNNFVAKDLRKCSDCDGDTDDYGGKDTDSDGN